MPSRLDRQIENGISKAVRKHIMDDTGLDIDNMDNLSQEQKDKITKSLEHLSDELAFEVADLVPDWARTNKNACESMKAIEALVSHLEHNGQTKEAEILKKVSNIITLFGLSSTAMVWALYSTRNTIVERIKKPHLN